MMINGDDDAAKAKDEQDAKDEQEDVKEDGAMDHAKDAMLLRMMLLRMMLLRMLLRSRMPLHLLLMFVSRQIKTGTIVFLWS